MSMQTHTDGTDQQDRTLSDLLETYRHLQSDPQISDERKQRASTRIKSVWADLAKLQDPDGFINHLSETIQREFQRRHNPEDVEGTRRGKPLCRCTLLRHTCEVKQGEVPSKIRTQDLEFIDKPSSRTLARDYVQEHTGDVIVREAMESYQGLRTSIYSELSSILAMMMGREDPGPGQNGHGPQDATGRGGGGQSDDSPSDSPTGDDGAAVGPDGGGEAQASDVVDAALASAVKRRGAENIAKEATEGALNMMAVVSAYQNGEVSTEELQAVADGERKLSELDVETEGGEDE